VQATMEKSSSNCRHANVTAPVYVGLADDNWERIESRCRPENAMVLHQVSRGCVFRESHLRKSDRKCDKYESFKFP
jgi:hypothetical protein